MSHSLPIYYNLCAICMDDEEITTIKRENGRWVSTQQKCFVPECGHGLHKECLSEYIIFQYENNRELSCPTCRDVKWINKEEINKIIIEMKEKKIKIPKKLEKLVFPETKKEVSKPTSSKKSKKSLLKMVALGTILTVGSIGGALLFSKKRKRSK